MKPGVLASDVARAENDVFRKYGMGEYVTSAYTRVRGHGLGLFADSKPHILEDVGIELKPGMTFVVHPNTYNPNVGYMMLGDSLTVTESGHEVFTTPRRAFSSTERPLNAPRIDRVVEDRIAGVRVRCADRRDAQRDERREDRHARGLHDFTRPGAVSWLCDFIPYWSECALVLPKSGPLTIGVRGVAARQALDRVDNL